MRFPQPDALERAHGPAAAHGFGHPPPLRVRTLGSFAVWRGDVPIPVELWQPAVAALFQSLLAVSTHCLHRAHLGAELYREAAPNVAAHRVRTLVYRLRRILDAGPEGEAGDAYVRGSAGMLTLVPAGDTTPPADWLDAAAFAREARAALAVRDVGVGQAALAMYRGPYLPTEQGTVWVVRERAALRHLHLRLTLHIAKSHHTQNQHEEARRLLQTVLDAEPTHEEAACALMEVLAAQGWRAEAMRVYETLTMALRADLGITPCATIEALRSALTAS